LLSLLNNLQSWRSTGPQNEDFGFLNYLSCVATPDLLFGFGELFRPQLVEHEGSLYISERFSAQAYQDWKQKLTVPSEIQKVMNHLHVADLFEGQEVSDELAIEAARLIATVWTRVFSAEGLVGVAFGSSFEDAEVTLYKP
jgi:hypothetical protein